MGAFLDKPKTEKYNESKTGAGLRYGLSSMQGWRIEMEDAHSAIIGIPDVGENISWFAVFDGHAGSRVSAHCSDHLLDCISSVEDWREVEEDPWSRQRGRQERNDRRVCPHLWKIRHLLKLRRLARSAQLRRIQTCLGHSGSQAVQSTRARKDSGSYIVTHLVELV